MNIVDLATQKRVLNRFIITFPHLKDLKEIVELKAKIDGKTVEINDSIEEWSVIEKDE